MEILSSILIFAAMALLVAAVANATAPSLIQERLARLGGRPIDPPRKKSRLRRSEGLIDDQRSWMVRALAPLVARSSAFDDPSASDLRLRLTRAGYRREGAVVAFRGSRLALALLLPVLAWFGPLRGFVPAHLEVLLPVVALAIGYVGPSWWVDRAMKRRQDEIDRHLPTALDLMVVCIEAGLGLVQSLARVGQEIRAVSPVIAEEFDLVSFESRTGKSNKDALAGLARRTGVREVTVLVTMLQQTERFGTNLADSLRVHCDAMRVARMQRLEEHAAKAPLKMLFPTSLILFALVGLIIGLAAIRATTNLG